MTEHHHTDIICTLTDEEQRKRKVMFREKLGPFLVSRAHQNGSTILKFRKDIEVEKDIESLIQLENECCSFLKFDMQNNENTIDVTVSGPQGSEDLIAELWGQATTQQSGQGVDCGCTKNKGSFASGGHIKAGVGFLVLCGLACTIPVVLAALGAISITASVIISEKIEIGIGIAISLVLSYILYRWIRWKWSS